MTNTKKLGFTAELVRDTEGKEIFYVVIATNYGVLGCWKNKATATQAVLDYFKFWEEDLVKTEIVDNCWNDSADEVVLLHGSKGTLAQIDKRVMQD